MVLVILAGLILLPPIQVRLSQLKREFNVEGGGRLTMWCKIAPALIKEAPQGIGYGCLTNERMRNIYRRIEPARNHLHANWAQVLVETGWVGLILYLVWMGLGLRDAVWRWRQSKTSGSESSALAVVVMLLLAGLLLNGLVEYNFGDTEIIFIYALVMGLAGSGQFPDRHGSTPDQRR
jgi:O-antigen ligase